MLSGCTILKKRNISEFKLFIDTYTRSGLLNCFFRKAHTLFSTVEEEIVYLEDRNLDDAQVDLLIRHEKRSDAAEVHLAEGRVLEAIDLFLDDNENRKDSIQRATDCVLQGLRKAMPLGGFVAGPEVTELFKRSDLLDPFISSQDNRDEVKSHIFMLPLIHSDCSRSICSRPSVQDTGKTSSEGRMPF